MSSSPLGCDFVTSLIIIYKSNHLIVVPLPHSLNAEPTLKAFTDTSLEVGKQLFILFTGLEHYHVRFGQFMIGQLSKNECCEPY